MSITDNVLQKTAKTARGGLHDRAVSLADIVVGDRLRALDRESVERLKESISKIGLKTPISVRSSEQGWTLVSGRHRLEACIELGMDEIPVVTETGSELEARLWEIAENLHRAELTALERAEHISLWIRLKGERGEGRPNDQAGDKLGQVGSVSELDKAAQAVPPPAGGGRGREGGVRAAARELGISRTDARRAVHRVHRIGGAVREALRDMPEIADNGAELDALAALPAEQQAAAVAAVKSGGAPNVRVAIATPTARQGRPGKAVGRPCRSVARGNQPSVHLPPSPAPSARRKRDCRAPSGIAAGHRGGRQQTRRNPAAGGAERPRHAEPSRCQGRPDSTDQRPVLRAGLCDRQCRIGGAAAAASKWRLTAPRSGARQKTPRVQALPTAAGRRAGFQSLGEIPLQICYRCSAE
jgi:ParB-like nuclease domain